MSVPCVRRSSAAEGCPLIAGAIFSCILIVALFAGAGPSRAAVLSARVSAHPRPWVSVDRRARSASLRPACVLSRRHRVRRMAIKQCKPTGSKRGHSNQSVARKRSQPKIPAAKALAAQPPTSISEQPQLPTTPRDVTFPIEASPPFEQAPPVAPPVKAPPVKPPPVKPPPAETPPVETPPVETAPFRFFTSTSLWNELLPAGALLDTSSASVVAALNAEELAEEAAKHGPAINTTSWSVPIYTVSAGQPTVLVTLVHHVAPSLQAAWSTVPLPANAQPAVGSDKHLVVWQPSTDRMWEFWGLEKVGEAWQASWGGAMQGVSGNRGVYGPEAWQGASGSWGASASSLPLVGGMITLEDLEKGKVNHALAISVPNVRAGVYALPAQRTDGTSTEPSSLPEGAHLRLDPALDLAALHLPPLTLMMAEAAQRYGIFVRDKASNLAFYAQDPTPTGTNPYLGLHGYFEGQSPSKLLASFPWSHLQLLKMELQ